MASVASFNAKEFRKSLQYSVRAESLIPNFIVLLRDRDLDMDPDRNRDGDGDRDRVTESKVGVSLLDATHAHWFNRSAELRVLGTEQIHHFKGTRTNSFSALPDRRSARNSIGVHSKKYGGKSDNIMRSLEDFYRRRDRKEMSVNKGALEEIYVICTVYSTAAKLRSHLLQDTQFTPNAVERKELNRRDEILTVVARPYCTRHTGSKSTGSTVDFATEALNALWTAFTQHYQQQNLDLLSFINSRGALQLCFFVFKRVTLENFVVIYLLINLYVCAHACLFAHTFTDVLKTFYLVY
jgi:hypothetical protein